MDSEKAPQNLGGLEQAVMDFIWANGPSTADQCRTVVGPSLKDSTIRTVLRRLEEKGYLSHTVEGRTFLYSAAVAPQRVAARVVQKVMNRLCSGSLEQLLVGMVDDRIVDCEELEKLARRIARAKAGQR